MNLYLELVKIWQWSKQTEIKEHTTYEDGSGWHIDTTVYQVVKSVIACSGEKGTPALWPGAFLSEQGRRASPADLGCIMFQSICSHTLLFKSWNQ